MSLYLIEKHCVAVVDGKAIHYLPRHRDPVEIDDAVAASLGDAVVRYGSGEQPSVPDESPAPDAPAEVVPQPIEVVEPVKEDKPSRRPRSSDG